MGVEGGAEGLGGCRWGWTTSELYLDCERENALADVRGLVFNL